MGYVSIARWAITRKKLDNLGWILQDHSDVSLEWSLSVNLSIVQLRLAQLYVCLLNTDEISGVGLGHLWDKRQLPLKLHGYRYAM